MGGIQEEESEEKVQLPTAVEEFRSKTPVEEAPFEPATKVQCFHIRDSLLQYSFIPKIFLHSVCFSSTYARLESMFT